MNYHIIKPYSTNKNFGGAINKAIEQLHLPNNSEDWILLMDGDACFLTPNWGRIILGIINNADDYDLIGCSTNRLREPNQTVDGMFDNFDLRDHYAKAIEQLKIHELSIYPYKHDLAGFFMLFRYSAWLENKFTERTVIFDRLFTRKITPGRVGIAPGLYVLHMYRLWAKNPKNDSRHLF